MYSGFFEVFFNAYKFYATVTKGFLLYLPYIRTVASHVLVFYFIILLLGLLPSSAVQIRSERLFCRFWGVINTRQRPAFKVFERPCLASGSKIRAVTTATREIERERKTLSEIHPVTESRRFPEIGSCVSATSERRLARRDFTLMEAGSRLTHEISRSKWGVEIKIRQIRQFPGHLESSRNVKYHTYLHPCV